MSTESPYQDRILDHYRNPRNFKSLKTCSHHGEAKNPTCGDRLSFEISVKKGLISDIGFQGEGCAISQASASLLTEYVRGKTASHALALAPGEVMGLLGISLSPTRMKCALLSLETLKMALKKQKM
mgnify:CR=1 FL=1